LAADPAWGGRVRERYSQLLAYEAAELEGAAGPPSSSS
jgi:hypothetical protein